MNLDEFWRSTPHETRMYVMARVEQRRDTFRLAIWQAWHAAAFDRTKRLPSLDSILSRMEPQKRKPQTPDEMVNVIRKINDMFGGKIQRAPGSEENN